MIDFDTLAVSLRSTAFQDHDKVVSFYSADYGEVRAIAKGVKKPTSKLAGACEPLTLNHVFFARGRNLHTVCHYERIESFSALRTELERLAVGTVAVDIVRMLGRENDPDSGAVYDLLALTLNRLNQLQASWIETGVTFHIEMLTLAGYFPALTTCVVCDHDLAIGTMPYHAFAVGLGGFLCPNCRSQFANAQQVNVSDTTIQLLISPQNRDLDNFGLKALKFLSYYWNQRLEQPVKSFEFLFELMEKK